MKEFQRELYKKYLEEFKLIVKDGKLPKVGEYRFFDGVDVRTWFDKTYTLNTECIIGLQRIINDNDVIILSDSEKEEIFTNFVKENERIPQKKEFYFEDNTESRSWFLKYIKDNSDYVTKILEYLKEFKELDLNTVWPECKNEFTKIFLSKEKILNYNEKKLSNGIDFRVLYEKLLLSSNESIQEYTEAINLYLLGGKEKRLTIEERLEELKEEIIRLRRLPSLRESRFSDGGDMHTWYKKYQKEEFLNKKINNLKDEVKDLLDEFKVRKITVYAIPNYKNTKGGKFYTICSNAGRIIDTEDLTTFEELQRLDPTIEKIGGIVLKRSKKLPRCNPDNSKDE